MYISLSFTDLLSHALICEQTDMLCGFFNSYEILQHEISQLKSHQIICSCKVTSWPGVSAESS